MLVVVRHGDSCGAPRLPACLPACLRPVRKRSVGRLSRLVRDTKRERTSLPCGCRCRHLKLLRLQSRATSHARGRGLLLLLRAENPSQRHPTPQQQRLGGRYPERAKPAQHNNRTMRFPRSVACFLLLLLLPWSVAAASQCARQDACVGFSLETDSAPLIE